VRTLITQLIPETEFRLLAAGSLAAAGLLEPVVVDGGIEALERQCLPLVREGPRRNAGVTISNTLLLWRNPIALLSASLSVDTTSRFGAPLERLASQAFKSISMRAQKPQLGRQKSTRVRVLLKAERRTVFPVRSGKLNSGANSPIFRPASCRADCGGAGSVPLSVAVMSARMASAPCATGLPICHPDGQGPRWVSHAPDTPAPLRGLSEEKHSSPQAR